MDLSPESALARLEPAVCLVDHIDPATAPYNDIATMAATQRTQGISDFHYRILTVSSAAAADESARDRIGADIMQRAGLCQPPHPPAGSIFFLP